jgi:hypothetical protein
MNSKLIQKKRISKPRMEWLDTRVKFKDVRSFNVQKFIPGDRLPIVFFLCDSPPWLKRALTIYTTPPKQPHRSLRFAHIFLSISTIVDPDQNPTGCES